jgi:lysophospholipase L1-like esterase
MASPDGAGFRPRWFLSGLVAGLGLMALLGWQAGKSDFHPGFTRFHPVLSPEANYFPSLEEMKEIVRARYRSGQVLVVVGGNSIMQGVSQPPERMWTRRLQQELGDRFCVINFGLRGAAATNGGAVVAEALREEFPRQILLVNERAMTNLSPLGEPVYQFLLWQAYFSGQLLKYPARENWVHDQLWFLQPRDLSLEIVLRENLDRAFHFHVFWNRVGVRWFNTAPSHFASQSGQMLRPRRAFPDDEQDGDDFPLDRRFVADGEMARLRAASEEFYERGTEGRWVLTTKRRDEMLKFYGEAFPAPLHARTLVVVGRDSAYYRQRLAPEEQQRDEQAVADSVALLRENGYGSTDFGATFEPEDYFDRLHLTPRGGDKLAARVAPAVRELAGKLGYLP